MASFRRKFVRPLGERRYRKFYVIAAEGARTEREYFEMLNGMLVDNDRNVRIKIIAGKNKSAPCHVLQRMTEYIHTEKLRKADEAWLVIDKDQWSDDQLASLHQWKHGKLNYYLAVSNPKFEYWLLLHFEDGSAITSGNCTDLLRKHLPDYDKRIDEKKVKPGINEAINRAKDRDVPPCLDWPRKTGTTIYLLIERIMSDVANDNR
ncbi:MAG: RloB family protein [bacterium]